MTAEEQRAAYMGCCGTVQAADCSSRIQKTAMGKCTNNKLLISQGGRICISR